MPLLLLLNGLIMSGGKPSVRESSSFCSLLIFRRALPGVDVGARCELGGHRKFVNHCVALWPTKHALTCGKPRTGGK